MKKLIVVLLVSVLLAGCAEAPVETTAPISSVQPTVPSDPSPTTVPTEPVEKAPMFYFSNALEMDRLYSVRTDGTDLTLILDTQCYDVTQAGDSIYFITADGLCVYNILTEEQMLLAKDVLQYTIDGNDLVYSAEKYGHPAMLIRHIDLTTLEDTLLLEKEYGPFDLCDGKLYYTESRDDYSKVMMVIHLSTGQTTLLSDKAHYYFQLHAVPGGIYCIANDDYWVFISDEGAYRRDNRIPRHGNLIHADENGVLYDRFIINSSYSVHYADAAGTVTNILRRTDLDGCTVAPLPEGNWLLQGYASVPWGGKNEFGSSKYYAYQADYTVLSSQRNLNFLDLTGIVGSMFPNGDFPVLDSSTARQPVTTALYNLFVKNYGYEGTEPLCSTTHGAWLNIADGTVDLAFLAAPTDEEQAYLKEKGVEVEMKLYGGDGLVFIGHKDNPVTNLTHEQIIAIFRGEITNWKELGGPNHPIHVYYRDDQSGSQRLFEKLVFHDLEIPDFSAFGFREIDTMSSIVGEILNDPYGIGYSIMTYLGDVYKHESLRVFSANGAMPSPATIQDYSYPYNTQGYLVIRKDEPIDSPARRLFDWFGCPMSDDLLLGNDVTPLHGEES